MIVTFRSKAAGDVIMFGDVAQRLMNIMGKIRGAEGIITVDQLPDAMARLRAAIAADKQQHADHTSDDMPAEERIEGGGTRPYVSLAQRAVPLLELLEWAHKKQKPVTWGM